MTVMRHGRDSQSFIHVFIYLVKINWNIIYVVALGWSYGMINSILMSTDREILTGNKLLEYLQHFMWVPLPIFQFI